MHKKLWLPPQLNKHQSGTDDEWRNREAEYINIPELPDEQPLTNGNLAYELEPVEYSIPPRVPPKRPAAPIIAASVEVESPDLEFETETPEVSVEVSAGIPDFSVDTEVSVETPEINSPVSIGVQTPNMDVELETEVSAAAAIEVETPEVELEIETPEVELEFETESPEVGVEVSAGIPDFSVDTEVSVETSELSVESPEVSFGIPDVDVDTEVIVETPEIKSPVSIGCQTPNFDMKEDIMASAGAELSVETVETVVEAAVQAAEDNDVEVSVETPGLVICQRAVLDVGRDDELDEVEVQTPTSTEGEESDSDSGDDLTPEEIKQKLAALGEFSDNLSSDEEDEYKVRFDASVSMLESVPEDATDSEAESEASSVDESGVDHQRDEDDHAKDDDDNANAKDDDDNAKDDDDNANAKDDDDNTTSF